ncbi:hypothetical protein CGE55_001875, partial [Salmonella enterica]|nr:hypothetical protein [Salmonella enterica]
MTTRSAGICEQEIERLKVDHVEGTCILPSAGLVWRRAVPTLRIRDPHKDEKMT